jgi:uncharacterized membrane protein YfcA
MDPAIVFGSMLVGIVVGLTGMGGGALMTPMLVLGFGVPPLTAVATDLAAATVMKSAGGALHMRQGSVNRPLAKWLMLGSVPAAFAGTLLMYELGESEALNRWVRVSIGVALLMVSATLLIKNAIDKRRAANAAFAEEAMGIKPSTTFAIGVFGGLVVGTTSVGSGSLMMVLLLLLYPRLRLSHLVGTDLVQAVPLVGAAAIAHAIAGEVSYVLAGTILLGAIPGVLLGARLSVKSKDSVIRPALVMILLLTGLKLVEAPLIVMGLGAVLVASGLLVQAFKQRQRLPVGPA